jgi:hypothetical protein
MPDDAMRRKLKGQVFVAVKSRTGHYQNLFIGLSLTTCGILIILIAIFLLWTTEPSGIHLFIGALGLIAVILGVDIVGHTMPNMVRESVVVDLRSARLLHGGRPVLEFPFGDRVRIGVVFNYGIHVPEYKPLYGVEFERAGETITISPTDGYDILYVQKLWPIAMAVTRLYKMEPTPGFKKQLQYEGKKGGYWEKVRDELLGEPEKLVKKAAKSTKVSKKG